MQGTFLLSHLLTRVVFKLDASNSFNFCILCDRIGSRG